MVRNIAPEDPLGRDALLAVESAIRIGPRHDDGAVDLDAGEEAARLDVAPHGLVGLEVGLEDGAGADGARDHGQVAAHGEARLAHEGVDGGLRVQHEHAVVDVKAEHEADGQRVREDARRRAPRPVGQPR